MDDRRTDVHSSMVLEIVLSLLYGRTALFTMISGAFQEVQEEERTDTNVRCDQ